MYRDRHLESIDGFYKSYSLIPTSGDATTAVVFVHGFAGSPTGTWRDFHGLCDEYSSEYPWWKDAALFFYSYNSIQRAIHFNAVKLRSFLEFILSAPVVLSATGDKKNQDTVGVQLGWKYKKLLLVGHSEGAVVIRRMVLNRIENLTRRAKEEGFEGTELREWVVQSAKGDLVLEAQLQLFAPACAGINFSGVVGFFQGLSHFFSALACYSMVRNELIKGSPILNTLQAGTEAAYRDYPNIRALPAKILFGTEDQVVYTDKYGCDEIVEPYEEGHDHFSICKPRYLYKRPLEFVRP